MRYYRDKVPDIAIPLAVDEKLDPFAKNMPNNESSQQLGDEQQMRGREGYYAVIDFVDDCMGELLDGLEKFGALDNTIIIYSSDRGEIAGDHGLWAKGLYFKEEIRVPLLMWPGASSRAVTAWPIRVADGSLPHHLLVSRTPAAWKVPAASTVWMPAPSCATQPNLARARMSLRDTTAGAYVPKASFVLLRVILTSPWAPCEAETGNTSRSKRATRCGST